MKFKKLAVASALALGVGTAQAALINSGFETGNLAGWSTSLSGGSASVVTSNTTTYSPGDWGTPHTFLPASGNFFLAIQSGAADIWQEVLQTVSLAAGQSVGGSARFDWGDYWVSGNAFPDGAKVEIRDSLNNVVATPFYLDGTNFCVTFCPHATGMAGAESPWTPWSFTAPSADNYTVVLAARNTADGGGPNQTYGYFDALQVPEPATLALLGLGLLGFGLGRRKQA